MQSVASAAVLLAGKMEENARKLKDVVIQCHGVASGVRVQQGTEARVCVCVSVCVCVCMCGLRVHVNHVLHLLLICACVCSRALKCLRYALACVFAVFFQPDYGVGAGM